MKSERWELVAELYRRLSTKSKLREELFSPLHARATRSCAKKWNRCWPRTAKQRVAR
jgi:hypothetical protein